MWRTPQARIGLALLAAQPASAAPWAETGDVQLRQDVELLVANGVLRGPVNDWPLPWAQFKDVENIATAGALPPAVVAAAKRVTAAMSMSDQDHSVDTRVMVTNHAALIRDFGTTARSKADVSAKVNQQIGDLFISLGVGYRYHQGGRDYHLEPSYAALKLGNVALYGGYMDIWWGPGQDGALMFSTNARPLPRAGLKLLEPRAINLPILRWLGPASFDFFVGRTEGNRNDYQHPLVSGLRVSFSPAPGLEIGLNREVLFCGQGALCTTKSVAKAAFGFGNADNTGIRANDPGDQLAGFDISYRTHIGLVAAQLYGEAEGEDSDGFILSQYARKAGTRFNGPIGQDGAQWLVGFEYTDTLASFNLLNGRKVPGSFYRHFNYTDGLTNRGRVLGESVGGDARFYSVDFAFTDIKNRRYYGSFRRVNLNRSEANDFVSANRENIDIATVGVDVPTSIGDLNLETRLLSDLPNTPNSGKGQAQFELGWRTRW
jgi:hypothetical protein